jgi:hypothetical protein
MAMLRLSSSILLALAQVVGGTSSTPPAAAPLSPAPTPSNPEERIALAQKVNGLHGLEQPWHLKASYEWFGPDGHTKDKGTYDE